MVRAIPQENRGFGRDYGRRPLVWAHLATTVAGISLTCLSGCLVPVGAESPSNTRPSPTVRKPVAGRSDPARPASGGPLRIRGETIDTTDMWNELRDELQGKEETLLPNAYRTYVEQRAARWINEKVADALLYHRASLRVSPEMEQRIDEYVDGEIRKIVTAEYGGVQRRYERHLESRGQTLDDQRARIRREVIVSSYFDAEIKPKIAEPTRAELLAAFEANRDTWRKPPRRSMSLIDVRVLDRLPEDVDTPTRAQVAGARAAARSIIVAAEAELRKGKPFGEVAREFSDGLHAAEGGAWGWVSRDSVRRRFEPAVDALYWLAAGEVSNIIETEDAFFLVRCDEVDPGVEPRFEDVQPELKERHFVMTYNRLIAELVAELRREERIDRRDLERFHAAVVDATLEQAAANSS